MLLVRKNIPKDSKYVVTCTHESYNEVIMLGMALLLIKSITWLKRII